VRKALKGKKSVRSGTMRKKGESRDQPRNRAGRILVNGKATGIADGRSRRLGRIEPFKSPAREKNRRAFVVSQQGQIVLKREAQKETGRLEKEGGKAKLVFANPLQKQQHLPGRQVFH